VAHQPRPGWLLASPGRLLAFGLGTGLSPVAPGTAGTLIAVPLYLLVQGLPLPVYTALVLGLAIAGIWICGSAARELGVHDHPGIVWDEIVGYLITMLAAPHGWAWVVAGFALFRLFDVAKPWPCGWIDRKLAGGLGIMLDDIVAGVYGWICLQLAAMWLAGRV
jgi:phosphatidylglycerophosphatase A